MFNYITGEMSFEHMSAVLQLQVVDMLLTNLVVSNFEQITHIP